MKLYAVIYLAGHIIGAAEMPPDATNEMCRQSAGEMYRDYLAQHPFAGGAVSYACESREKLPK
jgi:hypothetical protein